MVVPEAQLHRLFVLNVALQLFDGVATWQGVHHFGEGNPMLGAVMPYLGVGLTLVIFKVKACGLLVVLRRCWRHPIAYLALGLLAVCYGTLSFAPWLVRFASMLRV